MNEKMPFELIRSEGYITLKLAGELVPETAKDFEKTAEELQCSPIPVIVDCENLSLISKPWIRVLLMLSKKLTSTKKGIRYVSLSEAMTDELRIQGVLQVFPVAPTAKAALIDFGLAAPPALDVNFINPFLNAAVNVLKVQASTEAKAGQAYRKSPSEKLSGDISGVIGLVSEAFSGAVVISFPQETFLKIMSRMLGETITTINKEIEDGAGELTNIIFGQAKIELNERGYGIKTAIPSVIAGKDHHVKSMTRGPRVVIPFQTDVGGFVVEVCLSD